MKFSPGMEVVSCRMRYRDGSRWSGVVVGTSYHSLRSNEPVVFVDWDRVKVYSDRVPESEVRWRQGFEETEGEEVEE